MIACLNPPHYWSITSPTVAVTNSWSTTAYTTEVTLCYEKLDPLETAIFEFKRITTNRKALILAWNKAAQTSLFQATLTRAYPSNQRLQKLCYGRERKTLPIREVFKARVCGGHQRYRVMH